MRSLAVLSVTFALFGGLNGILADTALAQNQKEQGEENETTFPEKFWNYLQEVDYREKFESWPGKPDGFYPGQAPHGAFLKLFVNDDLLKNPEQPPTGSIIVKENYGEDKEKLLAITIMYKTKDFAPEHGNWWWVKYNADGTVGQMGDMPIAGKVQSCINCHNNAEGNDYVFTNDQAKP